MARIIGNTTAMPNPRPDWNQTDETKADYIKNKPGVASYEIGKNLTFEGRTFTASDTATISATRLEAPKTASFMVRCTGNVRICFQGVAINSFRVDGVNVRLQDILDGYIYTWEGKVSTRLQIGLSAGGILDLIEFIGDEYTDGFMSGEQAEKLENTYTMSETDKLLDKKSNVNHTHELAGTKFEDISLTDLANETSGSEVVIGSKSIELGDDGKVKFFVSGHIRFKTKGKFPVDLPMAKIDGSVIDDKGFDPDLMEPTAVYEFDGNVDESIEFISQGTHVILNFETFEKIDEKNGFMSAEQADKLKSTEIFTKDEKKDLAQLNNTPNAGRMLINESLTELKNRGILETDATEIKEGELYGFTYATFYTNGYIRMSGRFIVSSESIYVDGVHINKNSTKFSYEGFANKVEVSSYNKYILFDYFEIITYVDGFMSAERAKKLDDINLIDSDAVNALLQDYENNSETAPSWSGVNTAMDEMAKDQFTNGDDSNTIVVDNNKKIIAGAFGSNSVALNGKGQASGGKSLVAGSKNVALGNNSVAFGNGTLAAGQHSLTSGNATSAFGNSSFATGGNTIAAGQNGVAMGDRSKAIGINTVSAGILTEATGDNSVSIGDNTKAKGEKSFAEGYETESEGYAAHSMGGRTKAKAAYTLSGGFETIASGEYQTVIGRANVEDTNCEYLFIVGNGDLNDDYSVKERRNAFVVGWNGNAYFAGDVIITTENGEVQLGAEIGTLSTVLDNIIALQNELWGEDV